MYCQTINGKDLALKIKKQVRAEILDKKIEPGLAVILIGNDESSHLYVNLKQTACEMVGINFHKYYFEEDTKPETIIETINFLNNDEQVNGILVQLPLPKHFDTDKIIASINPKKDVDGFHPQTIKNLSENKPAIISPLARGVQEILEDVKQIPKDKIIAILCNHDVFAEPFKYLYGKQNKIFVYNQQTPEIEEKCRRANILIVAVGVPFFVTNDFIKKDAIIIDVGINKLGDDTVGDVDYEQAIHRASFITPVPGGIGPMTIAMLLSNTLKLYLEQNK